MKVIDMDSHSEPRPQDYSIEPEYGYLKPRVYTDARGTSRTLFNNKIKFIAHTGDKGLERKGAPPPRLRALYDAELRCEQLAEAGIQFQFVMAGGGPTDFGYVDSKVGASFCRGYNNFLYHNFMKRYPKTFSGLPALPMQDTGEAIKELERCVKDLGMRTFIMPTNWNGIDMADPYWWNFYEKVQELGITTMIVHIDTIPPDVKWVGKERLAVLGPDGTRGRRILGTPFEYCTNIVNLLFGGMMDSFPEFKIIFLEGSVEFVLPLKRRIDETVEQLPYLREKLGRPLDSYFKNLYFLVDDQLLEDSDLLRYAIGKLGADHLLFGSDYPHEDSLKLSRKLEMLPEISDDVKQKILGENAVALMGQDLA